MQQWWSSARLIFALVALASRCLGDEPIPPPNPSPDAIVPVASITLTDSMGIALVGDAQIGQQLMLSAEKAVYGKASSSLIWMIEAIDTSEARNPVRLQEFRTPDQKFVILTMPLIDTDIVIDEHVSLADRGAFTRLKIKCRRGGQPHPNPNPPNPVPPEPNPPIPTASKLFLAVVEDTLHPPADVIPTMNAIQVWNSFRLDGDDYTFYDASEIRDIRGRKAIMDAIKASLPPPFATEDNLTSDIARLKASGKLPLLVVQNLDTKTTIAVEPLPRGVANLKSTRLKYKKGANQ